MLGYLMVVGIIPLVVATFVFGNYTLYERTLPHYQWWQRYVIIAIIFFVQEYTIITLSYNATGAVYFHYVIPLLAYNLHMTYYGDFIAILTPVVINTYLILQGQTEFIPSLWIGLVVYFVISRIGMIIFQKSILHRMVSGILVINIMLPFAYGVLSQWGDSIYFMSYIFNSSEFISLCCGTMVLLLAYYNFFLREELENINEYNLVYRQSRYDELTGLGNYRSMLDYAEKEFSASTTGVICVVDMDHFKRVNDQWGHESGNRALKIFADYLLTSWHQVFEGEARIFRYGGEEFCILIKDIDDSEFDKVIQKIRYYQYQFMQLPLYIQRDHMVSLTFSVGVARWHKGDDLKSAFERADEALYVAKNSGRSQVRVYSDIVGKIKNENLEREAE